MKHEAGFQMPFDSGWCRLHPSIIFSRRVMCGLCLVEALPLIRSISAISKSRRPVQCLKLQQATSLENRLNFLQNIQDRPWHSL
jgi:hypothetical protein